jgi:hypothetical protein
MTLRGVLVVLLEVLMVILAFGTEFKNFLIIALCIGGLLIYSLFSLILASITLGVKSNVDASVVQRGEKVSYTLMIRGVALLPVASYFFVKEIGAKTYKRRKFRHSVLLLPNFSV